VFIHASPFRPPPHYSLYTIVPIRRPDGVAAVMGLRVIYKLGFNIIKAGVMLLDLQDGGIEQQELDLEPEPESRGHLMETMDRLNDRYGRGTLMLASAGTEGKRRTWSMRQLLRTPDYTTRWEDVPMARA
jgi:DNA polymerase V